jgi:MAF protein
MAEIKPIRAWRYNSKLTLNIGELVSPLFDVVSEKQRKVLYQNPFNSIHLSVPQEPDASAKASELLADWKRNGTIKQDVIPSIYVYYQYFKLAGAAKEFCRKGFICHIRAYDWKENVILRHENTIPKAVNDRIELLKKTELHASPTHGLYTDEDFELEKYMDEAMALPLYETEDYQGVRDVLAVIQDADVIQKFIDVIEKKKIILADGHHRYESSLALKHQREKENPKHTGQEGYNFHLIYLTNTEAGDLRILPTHRLINGLQNFNEAEIISKLKIDFEIKEIEDADTLNEIIMGKKWAFGVLFKDRALKIRLKPEAIEKMTWHFPDEIKKLDLTVLHYFIIERALGIAGKDQRGSENIYFDRSYSDCLAKVIKGEVQMAIITQEVSIEEIKQVCASGYTMPQKSTYFYLLKKMNFKRQIILASSSPRRQFLMNEVGFQFIIKSPDIDESFSVDMPVESVPKCLAEKKAKILLPKIDKEIIVASDTIVILGKTILNKPKDRNEAIEMLRLLSGKTHLVITGVCLLSKEKIVCFDDHTEVTFKKLTNKEIEFYIDTCKPFDKAGSYGAQDCLPAGVNPCSIEEIVFLESIDKMSLIEKSISGTQAGLGMVGIEKINGSYFTVMGLPIHRVYEELKKF